MLRHILMLLVDETLNEASTRPHDFEACVHSATLLLEWDSTESIIFMGLESGKLLKVNLWPSKNQ